MLTCENKSSNYEGRIKKGLKILKKKLDVIFDRPTGYVTKFYPYILFLSNFSKSIQVTFLKYQIKKISSKLKMQPQFFPELTPPKMYQLPKLAKNFFPYPSKPLISSQTPQKTQVIVTAIAWVEIRWCHYSSCFLSDRNLCRSLLCCLYRKISSIRGLHSDLVLNHLSSPLSTLINFIVPSFTSFLSVLCYAF